MKLIVRLIRCFLLRLLFFVVAKIYVLEFFYSRYQWNSPAV